MYLGIDLGTSKVKLLLLSKDHYQIVATTGENESITRRHSAWSERNSTECSSSGNCADRAQRTTQPSKFSAIETTSLSEQMRGMTQPNSSKRVQPLFVARFEAEKRDRPRVACSR